MPPVSLLIKPASSLCNLKCKYCFYHSIAEGRTIGSFGIMSTDILEHLVKKALKYAESTCTFAFQGGEPTLAGLYFFRKLAELQKRYNTRNVRIVNAIQTNGLVIDEEWCDFLAGNNFLVGISLDGPKDIHDMNRMDESNRGSYSKVMSAINLLKKHEVEYNILTVVNSVTARHINKVYSFLKKNDFRYLQFIPCLDPLGENPGYHSYSLTPEKYAYFLKTLFDLWYSDIIKGYKVSIRYFDNLVGMVMGYPPESCGMSGKCTCYFVAEADGSIYPCDFYVIEEWCLGNIREVDFKELLKTSNSTRFIDVSRHVDLQCESCKWIGICRGGCRRNREPFIDGKPVLNYYCTAYKEFFSHAYERLCYIAHMISSGK